MKLIGEHQVVIKIWNIDYRIKFNGLQLSYRSKYFEKKKRNEYFRKFEFKVVSFTDNVIVLNEEGF